jgi:heme O synthase-like polyprenyltransferase
MIPKPITKSGASLLPTSLIKDVPHAFRGTSAAMVATLFYRTGDYLALTKPRVMSLVVFTAAVGLLVAPGHLDPFVGIGAILCIAAGAGAAGALNMWYDADVDALMSRTAARPIPRGRVAPRAAVPTANQTRAYW